MAAIVKDRNLILIIVWVVLLIGIFCVPQSIHRALWIDDLYSLTTAEESIPGMLHLLKAYKPLYYDHPPLYFMMLHAVLYWGNSPLVLRMISLVTMGISIIICAWAVYRITGLFAAAFILCLLLALHPTVCYQATNVRMYGLFMLLTTAALWFVYRISRQTEKHRGVLTICLALLLSASVYTSYFGILFTVGVGVSGLLWTLFPGTFVPQTKRAGESVLIACALAALFTLPWTPTILKLFSLESKLEPYPTSRISQAVETCIDFGGTLVGVIYCLSGIVFLFLFDMHRKEWGQALIAFCVIPYILLVVMSPPHRIPHLRYIIFAVPVVIAAAVIGWTAFARRVIKSSRGVVVFVFFITIIPVPFNYARLHATVFKPVPDWWAAAQIIEDNARPEEIILTGGYLSGEAIVYHLDNPQNFSFIHYVTDLEPFRKYCSDPRVVWYVNAAPLPDEYEAIRSHYFPYRIYFEGNGGVGLIQVCSKREFTLPDGSPAPYHAP